MKKDKFGRVTLSVDDALEALYRGEKICNWFVDDDEEITSYKESFYYFQEDYDVQYDGEVIKPYVELNMEPSDFHAARQDEWLIPDDYKNLDIKEYLLAKCHTQDEIDRVEFELKLFEEKDLFPILRAIIYLIKTFRENKIVWGVGRGSSVASYCLYLIGCHKINSLKYDLDIHEFLK